MNTHTPVQLALPLEYYDETESVDPAAIAATFIVGIERFQDGLLQSGLPQFFQRLADFNRRVDQHAEQLRTQAA